MSTPTTSNLCIICGTKVYSGEDTTLINSTREICFKFTTFVSRYLKLESTKETFDYHNYNFCNVEDAHATHNSRKNSICCLACLAKVQAFCDTFHKLEYFQLKLFQISESLSKLMEVTSSTIPNKFQEEFISKVKQKRSQHGPFLRTEKINESELQRQMSQTIEFEREIPSRLVKTEMQDDDLQECASRCSEDFAEWISEFELEQKFGTPNENQGNELKVNFEGNVSDDYDTNGMNIEHEDIVNMKIGKASPQKAVSVNRKPKSKPKQNLSLPRQCLMCGKTFRSHFDLCNHIRTHIGEKMFHCRICLKEIAGSKEFKQHKINQHLNGGMECHICKKRVKNIESHCKQAHNPVTKAFCEKCGNTFNCEDALKRHVTFCLPGVIGEKKTSNKTIVSVCDICGKILHGAKSFRRHTQRIHGNLKPTKNFKCPYVSCKLAFYNEHPLLNHIRTHTGERPFQCEQCGRAFSLRSSLKKHIKSHSQIKKFICEICGEGFRGRSRLKKHEKTHLVKEEIN